ncbi:MAG TPA: peptidase domain-containing ABC transporter [Candidatus Angelobacter sp.]|nr:peptidase domain-containing ABC transporter [Candidatus Angelobacter sp.]
MSEDNEAVNTSAPKPSFGRKLPVIFQTEAAECGLTCLAMVASYHGKAIDLAELRRRFSISLRGTTLAHIIRFADRLDLTGRPLRIELEDLPLLKAPCILHWDMSHFVVLKSATSRHVVVHDPAVGRRKLSYAEASHHFTGVALELTPTPDFTSQDESPRLKLKDLTGRIVGLKRALGQIFALAAGLEIFAIISPLFLQLTIDKVVAAFDRDLLVTLGIGFTLMVVLQAVLGGIRSWTTLYFGTTLKLQWYANIFSHLVRLPVSFFEKRYFGDIMSRFESAEAIQRTLTNNFIEALLDGIISIFILGVMFFYSVKLAMVVVISVLLYALLRNIAYQPLRGSMEDQIIRMAKQQTFFMETLRGIRTIKTFGREDNRKTKWMNLLVDTTNAQVATEKLNILFHSANILIFGLQTVAIVWLGATLVLHGGFSVGMLFAFVAYQELFKARITALVDRLFEFRMLSLQAQRLADVVFEKPEANLLDMPSTDEGESFIEVKSLFFRYSEIDPWLLENVNLRIEPGECVAIVGPSGAGKSTLLKLMAGLLIPQAGDVIIGGYSVCTSRAAVLGRVGFVLQDDSLFNGTISENISFAADVPDMERVEECARLACLDDDIRAMPMAYNTLIGDMGGALSGGQQQRLLLARALYAKPSILILDEATSHLDVPTEHRIAAMLADLRITRVFAAHRPETIAIANRVISMQRPGSAARKTSAYQRSSESGSSNGAMIEKGEKYVES